jgi:hypothetical protein
VGASEAFLKEGENGFLFPSGSEEALGKMLLKIAGLSADERTDMGIKSHELANIYSAEKWSRALTHRASVR